MSRLGDIKEAIKSIAGAGSGSGVLLVGEVKSVDGEECSVTIGGLEIEGVRLTAASDGSDGKVVITPEEGSKVLVGDLSGGLLRELAVVGYTKVEKIEGRCEVTLNGGEHGGLVNIGELTEKLNALVAAFNAHTHQVSTSGTAAAQSGTAAAILDQAETFRREDYEDKKVKH